MKTSIAASAALLAGITPAAHAQFLSGITQPGFGINPPTAHFSDISGGTNTLLFDIASDLDIPATAPGFGGLAGDDGNRRFFAGVRNGAQDDIYAFNYDDLFNPTRLFTVRDASGAGMALDGLAFDSSRNTLYGTDRIGRQLVSIDLGSGITSPVFDYETQVGGAFTWTVTAIDYDTDTDLVYLVNEDQNAQPARAIWSFDPTNPTADLSLIAELPSFVTDVDGLGAGGGQLFLVTDNASVNNGLHTIFDLSTGEFSQPIVSPYPAPAGSPIAPNPSSGGAYTPNLPAPGTLGLFSLAGLATARRRR